MRAVVLTLPQIVEVSRLRKQITGDECDHFRIAATILTQVENDRVDVAKEVHGRNGSGAASIGVGEHIELQVADIAGENLDLVEAAVHPFHLFAILRSGISIGGALWSLRHWSRTKVHTQVLVVAHGLKIVREHVREGVAVSDRIVFAFFLPNANGLLHFLCGFWKNVELVQVGDRTVDDASTRSCIDFEIQVRHRGSGRNRPQSKDDYHRGITVLHLDFSKGLRIAVALLYQKFDVPRLALDDFE